MVAVVMAASGAIAGGQVAAAGFVGGGMLLLVASLTWVYARLLQPVVTSENDAASRYSLAALAVRNASRHPLRSTLTIGLMSTAAFLIIAISAFQLQPTERGTGGFTLVGQSAQPLFRDLRQPSVQSDLLGPDAAELRGAVIAPMRLRLGQDASCNNLYQATRPTVVGVPPTLAAMMMANGLPGFEWAGAVERADLVVPLGRAGHRGGRHRGRSDSR